jgi:hypothetical protein
VRTITKVTEYTRGYQHLYSDKEINAELQTVTNEEDDYGKFLLGHVKTCGFQLIKGCSLGTQESSTGHCVVMVCNKEQWFMTHSGCAGHFHASHIHVNKLNYPSFPECNHHHIHEAGYYNIPGFWNGSLEQVVSHVKQQCTSMNYTTTISLILQHDATKEWGEQLLSLLQYVDF